MKTIDRLALAGGQPAVSNKLTVPPWPQTGPDDERAVVEALRAGDLTSLSSGGSVERLEVAWAHWLGCAHCVAVSNGTAALKLALAALDIGDGDEVIVPALSFIASALAPLHVGARPVFIDIDPITFNLDVGSIEEKITHRTKAIMAVHLHGLTADMAAILHIAKCYNLRIIEDAAQAHGASYQGRNAGTIGDIGVFSLNASKNLPTCGEGGLITTNDPALAERLGMLRQFGERLRRGERRLYEHVDYGWNDKLSAVQAAYTLSRLPRFGAEIARRAENVSAFLGRLKGLPGLIVPGAPVGYEHAWHILRFRVDAAAAGLDSISSSSLRMAVVRALRAEGVPVGPYQTLPLPAQPLFAASKRDQMSRSGRDMATTPFEATQFPVCCAAIENSFTIQRSHLSPDAAPLMTAYADAFEKVFWHHREQISKIAATMSFTPPWQSGILQ
ncbi:DegT/DnrJ/EryC1/StrS family aminotransferase [Consotaella aegiceratis]|uniref:DegT/DnrJ/EryC1/StrS family aminotransferase n=1 Tax=Consotaella aegiceratis TaxID=3097961 RepID=UPI002F40E7C0